MHSHAMLMNSSACHHAHQGDKLCRGNLRVVVVGVSSGGNAPPAVVGAGAGTGAGLGRGDGRGDGRGEAGTGYGLYIHIIACTLFTYRD